MTTGNTIAVSEALAKEKDWTFGERVEVAFGDGSELSMQIGAIYTRAEILGDLVMPTDVWELQSTQPVPANPRPSPRHGPPG